MLGDPLGLKALGEIVDFAKEWTAKPSVANDISEIGAQVVDKLVNTPGMTEVEGTHFKRATPKFKLKNGIIIKTFRNRLGVDHVFLSDANGSMIFGGYVTWRDSENLKATIAEIKREFA